MTGFPTGRPVGPVIIAPMDEDTGRPVSPPITGSVEEVAKDIVEFAMSPPAPPVVDVISGELLETSGSADHLENRRLALRMAVAAQAGGVLSSWQSIADEMLAWLEGE